MANPKYPKTPEPELPATPEEQQLNTQLASAPKPLQSPKIGRNNMTITVVPGRTVRHDGIIIKGGETTTLPLADAQRLVDSKHAVEGSLLPAYLPIFTSAQPKAGSDEG